MMTDKDIVGKRKSSRNTGNDVNAFPQGRQVMHNLLKKAHEEYLTEDRLDIPRKEKIIKPLYYYIAASIMIVAIGIGVFYNFVLPSEEINTEQIYSDFYEASPLNISISDYSQNEDLRIGLVAYKNNKFALANELLGRVLEKNPTLTPVLFYRGISSMETGQYKQAIESFETILQSENSYNALAHWYLSLNWIKLNNTSEAKYHLQQIFKEFPEMKLKAETLLLKLK